MDVYALIGRPVEHSLSPPMHEAGYEATGVDARYVTFEPSSATDAVAAAVDLGVAGLNVTVPFKEEVLPAVEPTERARRVGAVNTVDFATSPPTGDNTDVAGVRRAFEHAGVSLSDVRAVVVGAGGAGRAATAALGESAASVHVANRTLSRAEALVADLDPAVPATLSAGPLSDVDDRIAEADVLVNATSVGMEADETPVPAAALHADLAVLDAVYTPLETRLLRDAAAAGAETVDGAWMLLFQGVAAFERWTGRDAPVDAMNETLRARL
ncbi:shikimate dehydrogenase [Halobaculum sp. MBLA0143]|uniref:shikimate dehydrogenase n=1 Tax=Halobaculum sp. MBLA0143 TaxID=3079933 RepID=UPI003525010D